MNKAIMIALTLAIAVCLIGLEANLVSSKDDREPVCSKYHFEEKVLEKLVRMEHSNAIMMEEFNGIKDKLSADLASMKKETEDMKIVHEQLDKLKINTEDLTMALQREITDFRKEINGKTII